MNLSIHRLCSCALVRPAFCRSTLRVGVDDLKSPTPVFPPKAGLPHRRCLLLVVDIHVLGVDDTFVLFRLRSACCTWGRVRRTTLRSSSSRLIHRLRQLVAGLREPLVRGLEILRRRRAFEGLFGIGQGRLDVSFVGSSYFFAALLQHLF